MMKSLRKAMFLLALGILLAGCSALSEEEGKGNLVRIDMQRVDKNGTKSEERILVEDDDLEVAQKAMGNTEWQPNTKPDMARVEDVLAIFFYKEDKNMPEALVQYQVWFEVDDSATIISNDEDENYGKLNPENAQILKNLFQVD
ncbi:hypothetical protein DVB69_00085 [Sporosarcina sp. BI001-red]|uniref:hypothetical protein n=1 Tax=Sporosarcina sp. BI001-red TaxID=2282866 RepID=UPI000E288A66|nr:hypothetical protein [Sporosarcina sp. BI001-red]REB11580.1 hypothetical protein DVB69_00085 [Sporosarcina sp. BI001-red]